MILPVLAALPVAVVVKYPAFRLSAVVEEEVTLPSTALPTLAALPVIVIVLLYP